MLLGVPLLIAGFVVNPGPPSGDTTSQLVVYGVEHHTALTVGGWLQVTGTVMAVIFGIAIVTLCRQLATLPGILVVVGSMVLIAISLSELTAYSVLAAANPSSVATGAALIPGVQLGYSVVAAPVVFGALGVVVLKVGALPKGFGFTAILLGMAFCVCGVVTVVSSIQGFIDVLSGVQAIWWLSAGTYVAARGLRRIEYEPTTLIG